MLGFCAYGNANAIIILRSNFFNPKCTIISLAAGLHTEPLGILSTPTDPIAVAGEGLGINEGRGREEEGENRGGREGMERKRREVKGEPSKVGVYEKYIRMHGVY